jgi:hypothetical protein
MFVLRKSKPHGINFALRRKSAYNPGMDEPVVTTEELHGALEARRELGPEYEEQIADALADRIEKRLVGRLAQRAHPHTTITPLALGSLGLAIPLSAVAGDRGGLAGLVVAWAGIVLVNLGYAFRRR